MLPAYCTDEPLRITGAPTSQLVRTAGHEDGTGSAALFRHALEHFANIRFVHGKRVLAKTQLEAAWHAPGMAFYRANSATADGIDVKLSQLMEDTGSAMRARGTS